MLDVISIYVKNVTIAPGLPYTLGITWDVPYHPYLDEYIYDILTVGICNRFDDFFALHISRPRSNYDVRLYSTA